MSPKTALVALSAALSTAAIAAPVTITFSGVIDTANSYSILPMVGRVAYTGGTTFSGSLTYDMVATPVFSRNAVNLQSSNGCLGNVTNGACDRELLAPAAEVIQAFSIDWGQIDEAFQSGGLAYSQGNISSEVARRAYSTQYALNEYVRNPGGGQTYIHGESQQMGILFNGAFGPDYFANLLNPSTDGVTSATAYTDTNLADCVEFNSSGQCDAYTSLVVRLRGTINAFSVSVQQPQAQDVPEPATLALAGLALAGCFAVSRRRSA